MGLFTGSDMKKLKESSDYEVLEVGDLLYLYVPKNAPQRVIISAHGGHAMVGGTNSFVVPDDTVVQFYSDDRYSVLDPGLANVMTGIGVPKEVLSTGEQCFDYILSKYQGRHNKMNETYESIGAAIESMRQMADIYATSTDKMRAAGKTDKGAEFASKGAFMAKIPAVLTVRNRRFRAHMTLQQAIAAVKKAAPSVQIFDCLFCRSGWKDLSQGVEVISVTG